MKRMKFEVINKSTRQVRRVVAIGQQQLSESDMPRRGSPKSTGPGPRGWGPPRSLPSHAAGDPQFGIEMPLCRLLFIVFSLACQHPHITDTHPHHNLVIITLTLLLSPKLLTTPHFVLALSIRIYIWGNGGVWLVLLGSVFLSLFFFPPKI